MNSDIQGIYDARELGKPKFVVLGVQHLFAMFGATILVPLITGRVLLPGRRRRGATLHKFSFYT